MSKSFIFLVESFLGNFYSHTANEAPLQRFYSWSTKPLKPTLDTEMDTVWALEAHIRNATYVKLFVTVWSIRFINPPYGKVVHGFLNQKCVVI